MDSKVLQDNLMKRFEEVGVFTRKFGSFSKADFELLLFTAYLDSYEETVRDYDLSLQLGITETKARNLRIKSQLLYPKDIDEAKELAEAISSGRFNPYTREITITIENPSVRNSIKNTVESSNHNVGISLNSKQLILPVESIVILAILLDESKDDLFERIRTKFNKETVDISKIEKGNYKDRFFKNISSINEITSVCNSIVPFFTNSAQVIQSLVNVMHLI